MIEIIFYFFILLFIYIYIHNNNNYENFCEIKNCKNGYKFDNNKCIKCQDIDYINSAKLYLEKLYNYNYNIIPYKINKVDDNIYDISYNAESKNDIDKYRSAQRFTFKIIDNCNFQVILSNNVENNTAVKAPVPIFPASTVQKITISKNGKCGPNNNNTRCIGYQCCSSKNECGGEVGKYSSFCIETTTGDYGQYYDGNGYDENCTFNKEQAMKYAKNYYEKMSFAAGLYIMTPTDISNITASTFDISYQYKGIGNEVYGVDKRRFIYAMNNNPCDIYIGNMINI